MEVPAKLEIPKEPATLPRLLDNAPTPAPRVILAVEDEGAPRRDEPELPTLDNPEAEARPSIFGHPSTVRTATHVLRREEATRAAGFARCVFLLALLGLAVQPVLETAVWMRVLGLLSIAATLVASAWMWRLARDPLRYTPRAARTFAAVCTGAGVVVEYYLGVFSPAPMMVVLGITFFATNDDRRVWAGLTAASAAGYVLLALLLSAGVLPDAGVMHALDAPPNVRLIIAGAVPALYGLALWQARVARRAMLDALKRSNDQMRERMRKEAQAAEANRDIDMLLRVGVRNAGPYSGVACGKYVLGDMIGRGAMGEVYAAKDSSGQTAAVKLLQPSMLADQNLILRFLREGEAASKLRGPNVVSIFEVGKTDEGAPFIVMELLRGHDLAWHLQHRIHLSLDEVVGIVDQVAEGLEAARTAGIVHRDLKPQNLFLAQQPGAAPLWKILDFGVSRLIGSGGTLTQEGIVGTPGYMSPEQAAGREATHRSDVFSFGVVVYRALTGEPPFTGPDTPQILYQVVYRAPPRPGELVRALPPDVNLAIAIALAKDPEDRFPSALDFAAALRKASRGELEPSLRLHAQTLLAGLPWGRALREGSVE